jgi:hypothetical protein
MGEVYKTLMGYGSQVTLFIGVALAFICIGIYSFKKENGKNEN